MEPRIVPIEARHIEGFHATLDAVARERRYLAFLEGPPIASTREFVLGNIADGHPQYVAVDGEAVIGWCDVTPKARAVMRHSGVLGMGIVAAYRGQGVGAKLMAATLEAARTIGLTRVELTVRVDNQRAVRLYEKFGFQEEGRIRRFMLIDNEYVDGISMAVLF